MCPKFKEGICDIAGIEPEHVECVNQESCFMQEGYKSCELYYVGLLEKCNRLLTSV